MVLGLFSELGGVMAMNPPDSNDRCECCGQPGLDLMPRDGQMMVLCEACLVANLQDFEASVQGATAGQHASVYDVVPIVLPRTRTTTSPTRSETSPRVLSRTTGAGATMKLTKKTITFEVPSSAAELVRGLDLNTIYPQLEEAKGDLADAQRRLEGARNDVRARQARVDQLAHAATRNGGLAQYAEELSACRAAEALITVHERVVRDAQRTVASQREAACVACADEAGKRYDVLAKASAVLLAELAQLASLESALRDATNLLPTASGAGLLHLGSIRDATLETVVSR